MLEVRLCIIKHHLLWAALKIKLRTLSHSLPHSTGCICSLKYCSRPCLTLKLDLLQVFMLVRFVIDMPWCSSMDVSINSPLDSLGLPYFLLKWTKPLLFWQPIGVVTVSQTISVLSTLSSQIFSVSSSFRISI